MFYLCDIVFDFQNQILQKKEYIVYPFFSTPFPYAYWHVVYHFP